MKLTSVCNLKFKYPIRVTIAAAFMPAISAIYLCHIVVIAFQQYQYFYAVVELMLLFVIVYFVIPLFVSVSSVVIDDVGISSYLFGMQTQSYKWNEIKRIRKSRSISNTSMPNEFIDVIHRERHSYNVIYNAYDTIRVNNIILDYDSFRKNINVKSALFDIPLFFVDERIARAQKSPLDRVEWMNNGLPIDRI